MIKKIAYFGMVLSIIALCITTIVITYTLKSPYELMLGDGDLELQQFNDADNYMIGKGRLIDKRYFTGTVVEEEQSFKTVSVNTTDNFELKTSLNEFVLAGSILAINDEGPIIAPVDGKVVEINNIDFNCNIILLDFTKLKIVFSIDGDLYANVDYHTAVKSYFGDYSFVTNIEFIDYKIVNGEFKVQANYKDEYHVTCPGLQVKVEVVVFQKDNCYIVPKMYLRQNSQGYYLVFNEQGQYNYRNVVVGKITESEVEILSGVSAGQIISFPNDGNSD
jgi:hypothetical protein